jgi:hypothetical protein
MSDGMPEEDLVLVLRKPLVLADRTISELTIKEPSAGALALSEQSAKKGMMEQNIILLGLATDLHPSIIKQLSGGDFTRAAKLLGSFFEDGPETTAI